MPWPFPMRSLRLSDAQIHFVDRGDGAPVVLLHGYPESHAAWRHLIEPLAATRRVIVPDWIGWGRSTRDPAVAASLDADVARLEEFVSQLGIDAFDLCGHDYGGLLALSYLAHHRARVTRLAIINSRAHRTFAQPFYATTALVCAMARHKVTRALLRAAPIAAIHRVGLEQYIARGCFDDTQIDEYIGWMNDREAFEWWLALFASYEARADPALAASLASIACPTAVIWGTRDPWCPLAIAEDLVARVHTATLTRIEGADHFVLEERPREVLDALCRLLVRERASRHELRADG